MLCDASMGPIFGHFQRPRARHCHLQCFDAQLDPISVRGLSQYFGSSSLLFVCSVDRALTESVNCSDVWNVWYSSAHYTIDVVIFLFSSVVLHHASALAQESAARFQTELHSCFESCFDSRERVVSLGAVARTPQSHEHVLVVSCIGASLLLCTMFTLSLV